MTNKKSKGNTIASLIEKGGVYYNVPGKTPKELITGLTGLLPPVPGLNTENLLTGILEREALFSTGIGRGIALPHPRNPVINEGDETTIQASQILPLVALAFPASPIDWHTPDGSKVFAVFLLVSVSAKQHLDTLSKINFLCQQEKFYSLIKERALKEKLVAVIQEAETAWAKASI